MGAAWAAAGATATLIVAFISQGPDSIRRIPEIPRVAMETVGQAVENHRINRGLSKVWVATGLRAKPGGAETSFELDLTCSSEGCSAAVTSAAMRPWSPFVGIVNAAGTRHGRFLHLTVFDWVDNKRVDIAELEVEFQRPPDDGISDHVPPLVEPTLIVAVKSQVAPVLPPRFELRLRS